MSLSEAEDKLSSIVDEAASTHEVVTITKHGHPAAVLMVVDDLDSGTELAKDLGLPEGVGR